MSLLDYSFTTKKISAWGGLRMLHELYVRSGLRSAIASSGLPTPGSNRGYNPLDVVEGFMVSVILGAKRLAHSGSLRHDEVIKEIFGWKKGMASQSTFSRFFRKFGHRNNDELFPALQRWWFQQFAIDKLTIDFDSTVLTRYGQQEGVKKGYNPRRKGRGSHHPIMAFAAELNMVVNGWMRTGDSADATQFEEFFAQIMEILPAKRIGLIRGDAGFYGQNTLQLFESQSLKYIVAAHMKGGLRARIATEQEWLPVNGEENTGLEYCTFRWRATGWKHARRFVIVKKDRERLPKAPGKLLFPDVEEFESYVYSAFVTNLELSAELVWELYRKRANAENRIKELKYDYGIEGFCLDSFGATENVFRWILVAYNLMALFKLVALRNREKFPTTATVNFQCIALGSYLSRSARKTTLKIAAIDEKQAFIRRLFRNISTADPPYRISNA